jgi:hypothetical protein
MSGTPPELPRYAERPPQPDLELVPVFECNDPVAIAFAKTVLEEAGIEFCVEGGEAGANLDILSPFSHPSRRVVVARDREAEARTLLQPLDEIASATPTDSAEEWNREE